MSAVSPSAPGAAVPPMRAGTDRSRSAIRLRNGHVVIAASTLILLPNILFAAHLQPLAAAILFAGGLGSLGFIASRSVPLPGSILAEALSLPRLLVSVALALGLFVLGGEGHLMFANWDWLWRDAVLSDLVRAPFPPTYDVGGETFLLRAPLGMYMLPAFIGRLSSLGWAHAALLAQNTLFLGLILYMLATVAGRRAILVVVVFLSFSGLDVVGTVLMWLKQGNRLSDFVLPSHIESWIGLQYSSVVTQVFWVPNHALPSYWLALLAVLCARRELALAELGVVLAASLFWSPFAFIGTLPFAVYLLVRDARVIAASSRFRLALAVALCFLPVVFYLKIDAGQVPHEFLLFQPFMASTIALFLLIEIPQVAVVRLVFRELDPTIKGVTVVAVVTLLVLPTMRLGLANDLVMRASIPALTLLAFAFAEALAIAWRTAPGLCAVGGLLALIGAVTPGQEIIRALTFRSFAVSDCNLVTVWKTLEPSEPALENYLAGQSRVPDWLMKTATGVPAVDQPAAVCWPDIPYDPHSHITVLSDDELKHQQQ